MKFYTSLLLADLMIEMIATNLRKHIASHVVDVLVACMHTIIFVRNTYLEELFDHIASQSMYIWGFHCIHLVHLTYTFQLYRKNLSFWTNLYVDQP